MIITLGKTTFKLERTSSDEFIQRLNDYLLKAPSNSSPGDPEFAAGEVNILNKQFEIFPFFTGRRCLFPVGSFGTIRQLTNESLVDVTFKSKPWGLLILIGFFAFIAITFWNVENAYILFIFFGIPLGLGAISERKYYLKSAKRQLEFLRKLDSH